MPLQVLQFHKCKRFLDGLKIKREAIKKLQKDLEQTEKQIKKIKRVKIPKILYNSLILLIYGGEEEIRTLESLLSPTPLAGERLRPLGHLSKRRHKWSQQKVQDIFDFFSKISKVFFLLMSSNKKLTKSTLCFFYHINLNSRSISLRKVISYLFL